MATSAHAAEQLEEIRIQGSTVSAPKAELPLGTAISGKTLKTVPGSAGDPLRSIQALPGVTVNDDTSAAPAIRGSRPGDNIYQVDFLPSGYLFHLGGAISVFNSELVDQFNLYSSAYGPEFSGVTGGVIDTTLRDPKTDRFHATVDASFLHTGLLFEGPVTQNQSFYLAGRISYLDLLVKDQLDTEDGIEFIQYPKYSDYQGKYRWDLNERGVVKLQITGASDLQEINVLADADGVENEPDLLGRHFDDTSYHSQGIVWDLPFGKGHKLKSAIAHYSSTSESQVGSAGSLKDDADTVLGKAHLSYQLSDKHTLKTGAEVANSIIDYAVTFNDVVGTEFEPQPTISGAPKITTTQHININNVHFFAQDAWFANDRLSLYTGVVYQGEDYLDKYFVEPRLALEIDLGNDWLFNAGAGLYNQRPGFAFTDPVFGNPDLDYIKSKQAVVGVKKSFGAGWSWKSDLYYKDLDDLVTTDDTTRYANNGEGYAYGLETLIRKDLTDAFSGWLSVTLSEARRKHKITGKEFPFDYDQPVNASLVAQYKWSDKTTFGAKYWLHSGSPYTPVIGAIEDPDIPGRYEAIYADVNSDRLPAFNRLDLRVDRKFKDRGHFRLTGYMELLNALGTKNVSGYDYNKDYSSRSELHQLPRLVSFGIKADF
ncbi:MAG: hypothetical protein DSZ32_07265 [Gammaproteobacteria bacterium]|nr:MAG: hypothetical protein DSZ32_07265 [Gammaproteobacteria bacterium]